MYGARALGRCAWAIRGSKVRKFFWASSRFFKHCSPNRSRFPLLPGNDPELVFMFVKTGLEAGPKCALDLAAYYRQAASKSA